MALKAATMIQIAVINESTAISDGDLQVMIPAFETQWNRDLAPIWSIDQAHFTWTPKTEQAPVTSWWVVFLDDSDQGTDLAYHDLTSAGLPLGKVFVKTILADKSIISVKATHEICEMAVDPNNKLAARHPDGTFWACEICDPVDSDEYGYEINGVRVSDFVTPAWFGAKGATGPYDFKQHVTSAFEVLAGGYAQKMVPQFLLAIAQDTGWAQVNGEKAISKQHVTQPPAGSRRHRRVKPRHNGQLSDSAASRLHSRSKPPSRI
jgi:hypothetical protein